MDRVGRRRWVLLAALVLVSPCPRAPAPEIAPAEVAEVVPEVAPVVLPSDPWSGLCEVACDRTPSDPPERLAPADDCPLGTCPREVHLEFGRYYQVELGAELLVAPTTLRRWTGPLVFQVYTASGDMYRCSVEVAPMTRRIQVRPAERKLEVADPEAGAAHPCEEVHDSEWSVGSILNVPQAELDAGLDAARVALSRERFASDDDVSRWLWQQHVLPPGAWLARRHPDARATAGDAVAYLAIAFSDLSVVVDGERYCTPFCDFDQRFVGPLRSAVSVRLKAEGEKRFCERWAQIQDKRFVATANDRLATVFSKPATCRPHWHYVETFPRVAFDAPPERVPVPRSDPELPKRIDPDTAWMALGRAAGLEVVYVSGHARDGWGVPGLEGHAWNAARVDGRWVLLDATWDAGSVGDGRFTRGYTTRWLFVPPPLFAVDHHPSDAAWQLIDAPESAETFARRPGLGRDVLLLAPVAAPAVVDGDVLPIELGVAGEPVSVGWRAGDGRVVPCRSAGDRPVRATCAFNGAGPWTVEIAASDGRLVGLLEARR